MRAGGRGFGRQIIERKVGGEEERGDKDRLKEVQTREVMEVLEAMMVVVGGRLPGP